MDNPVPAMPALASQHQFPRVQIEIGTPANQLLNAFRGLPYYHFDNGFVAKRPTCCHGIGNVVFKPIFWIHHPRDAALGKMAVGLLKAVLGNDQHRK